MTASRAKVKNLDSECITYTQNPNLLVPWYLTASYLYYVKDISLLSDTLYDLICKHLDKHWDSVEHYHKHLIIREDLSAGTGFALDYENFPERIKSAAMHLASKL